MPFSNDGGLIAGLLHKLGKGLLGPVEFVPVSQETILVGILSSLDRGSLRTADRVGYVAALE